MKRILAISLTIVMAIAVVAFADEGEMDEPSNVAPAIIQAPPETAPVSQPAAAPRPAAAPGKTRTVSETTLRTADEQYMQGSVSCIVPSSIMQHRAKIVIKDQNGDEIEFTVKTLAVIYDPTGAIMSLDKLQQGTKVRIHYKGAGENARMATSIKVLR